MASLWMLVLGGGGLFRKTKSLDLNIMPPFLHGRIIAMIAFYDELALTYDLPVVLWSSRLLDLANLFENTCASHLPRQWWLDFSIAIFGQIAS